MHNDPALKLLKEALSFEHKKLSSREWSAEIVTAIGVKIKSYEQAISQRQKSLEVDTTAEETPVNILAT